MFGTHPTPTFPLVQKKKRNRHEVLDVDSPATQAVVPSGSTSEARERGKQTSYGEPAPDKIFTCIAIYL